MEGPDVATADESEDTLDERLPSWALGVAFVIVVAMLPAIVIIAMVTDLSDAQTDVFNIAMGIVAVILGAGFGVAIQAGNVRAARRERDREQSRRIAEVEEERTKREAAVREAQEAERGRSDARHERVKVEVLEAVSRSRGPRIRTVSAGKLKSAKFMKKARKSKDAFYVKASRDDVPEVADPGAIAADVARAFDEPDPAD